MSNKKCNNCESELWAWQQGDSETGTWEIPSKFFRSVRKSLPPKIYSHLKQSLNQVVAQSVEIFDGLYFKVSEIRYP